MERLDPGKPELRLGKVGGGFQRRAELVFGIVDLAGAHIGLTAHDQLGLRQFGRRGLGRQDGEHVAIAALHHQRLRQLQLDLVASLRLEDPAQLLLGGNRVAGPQVKLPQQLAGLQVGGVLLDRVPQLDDGGTGVARLKLLNGLVVVALGLLGIGMSRRETRKASAARDAAASKCRNLDVAGRCGFMGKLLRGLGGPRRS